MVTGGLALELKGSVHGPGLFMFLAGLCFCLMTLVLYQQNERALRDELARLTRGAGWAGPAPVPLAGQGDRLERAQTSGRYVARGVKWLTQADYAELLDGDRAQWARFELAPELEGRGGGGTCRTCHFGALMLEVAHPIWDGPLDGAGTGVVDVRRVPWCLRCEGRLDEKRLGVTAIGDQLADKPLGPWHELAGLPVRLPWLDNLPVRLVPQLFERPAFHRLMVGVERWTPPAVPNVAGLQAIGADVLLTPEESPTGELEERKCPHGVVHRDPFKRDGEASAHCAQCQPAPAAGP